MHEYVRVAHWYKGKLAKIWVCREVLKGVQLDKIRLWAHDKVLKCQVKTNGLAKKAIGLVFVLLPPLSTVETANVDTTLESTANEGLWSIPWTDLWIRAGQ
jgi:hypothetical protein